MATIATPVPAIMARIKDEIQTRSMATPTVTPSGLPQYFWTTGWDDTEAAERRVARRTYVQAVA